MLNIFNRFEYFYEVPIKFNANPVEYITYRRHKKTGNWEEYNILFGYGKPKFVPVFSFEEVEKLDFCYFTGKLDKYKDKK